MSDPQVNPNALGAPTEGFGQTVSFAFDPRGVTPSMSLTKSTPRGVGMSGVSRGRMSNPNDAFVPVKTDATSDLLMRLGKDILAPRIEEERNAKFVEGIQKAMQGEAVKDMAQQQPWYSRIFGDTPMMEGARAYEVSAKVNEVVAQQTANMESIKELNAADAAKHFAGVMKSSMTGDPSSDALISKHLIDAMPGMMKSQAKLHYGWGQKRAMDALSTNMDTAFASLQEAGKHYAQDFISEDDMNVRRRSTLASIMPPDGINEENYGKVLSGRLKGAADRGWFHAIEAVRASGGLTALTEEQRTSVERTIESAAVKNRDRYAYGFAQQIAELRSDAAHPPEGTTPAMIADRFQKMNDSYKKLSGSPVGLFTSDEVANGTAGTLNAIKAEEVAAQRRREILADKHATEETKRQAALEQSAAVSRAILRGDVLLAKKTTKATDDDIDMSFYQLASNGSETGSWIVRQNFAKSGYVNPIIKADIRARLVNSEGHDTPSDDFFAALQTYQQMKEGMGSHMLADAYFGDYAPKLERYMRLTAGTGNALEQGRAFRVSFDPDPANKPKPLERDEVKKLTKEISSRTNSMIPRWLGGGVNLRDDTVDRLATMAKAGIEDWQGAVPTTEAVQRGINGVLSSRKVELIGGFAVDRAAVDTKVPTLRELASGVTSVPAGSEDKYFEAFLASRGFAGKGSVSLYHSGKRADGALQFSGTVYNDGDTRVIHFTDREWKDFAAKTTLKDTAPQESTMLHFGPKITYKIDPDMPSIYSDPNGKAWREYGAKKEAESRKRFASTQPK